MLAACQQDPARVRYQNEGGSKIYSDEVIKVPTRSVAPAAVSGSAGREAAGYYQQQRLPAARIGAEPLAATLPPVQGTPMQATPASPTFAPPQPYHPAPVRGNTSPFGTPSAPLSFAPVPGAAEPTRAFASGSALPMPLPSSLTPSTAPAPAPNMGQYQAMLAGSAPPPAPALTVSDPYSGNIPLGGAYGGGAYSAMPPANMAAPSLPVPASIAAAQPTPPQPAPQSDFVINGMGETLKVGGKAHEAEALREEGAITQAEAAPVITPVSSSAMGGKSAAKAAPMIAAISGSQFVWPTRGPILSGFGPKGGGKSNDGINISAPAGTPIHAAADGMVVYAGNELQGYGNMLVISHDGGKSTVYAHASSLKVKKGDLVHQGQTIGFVGQTGGVTQPQLHFALRQGSNPVNPMDVLKK